MMGDVCQGVSHIHEHGFVHSDMKLENVLLKEVAGRRYIAKVSDFGFAYGERTQYTRIIFPETICAFARRCDDYYLSLPER